MKKAIFLLTLFVCAFPLIYTSFFRNLWLVATENGYEIPKESSIFTFEATKMNDGSGGYWMYGEDNKKFYALSMDSINKIISIEKNQSQKIKYFDKLNYKTWE